jgi:hypothetical protein
MSVWDLLVDKPDPADCPPPAAWQPCFATGLALMRLLAPRSIVQFGGELFGLRLSVSLFRVQSIT